MAITLELLVSLSLIFNVMISLPLPSRAAESCNPSGTLVCKGKSYPKYTCSPPVTSSTKALLTLNDFSEGGDGGGPSYCDGKYHPNSERVVALPTGWFNNKSRCGKLIKIVASNGKSVTAKVVDECDSRAGCDKEHAGQPPCRNNIIDGSSAVWNAFGAQQRRGCCARYLVHGLGRT